MVRNRNFEWWFYQSDLVRNLVELKFCHLQIEGESLLKSLLTIDESNDDRYFFNFTQMLWECWQEAQKSDTESK